MFGFFFFFSRCDPYLYRKINCETENFNCATGKIFIRSQTSKRTMSRKRNHWDVSMKLTVVLYHIAKNEYEQAYSAIAGLEPTDVIGYTGEVYCTDFWRTLVKCSDIHLIHNVLYIFQDIPFDGSMVADLLFGLEFSKHRPHIYNYFAPLLDWFMVPKFGYTEFIQDYLGKTGPLYMQTRKLFLKTVHILSALIVSNDIIRHIFSFYVDTTPHGLYESPDEMFCYREWPMKEDGTTSSECYSRECKMLEYRSRWYLSVKDRVRLDPLKPMQDIIEENYTYH